VTRQQDGGAFDSDLDAFLSALPDGTAVGDRSALADHLSEMVAQAVATLPGASIPPRDYLRYVARRLPPDSDALAALSKIRTFDLYLTCGCVLGDAAALRCVEERGIRPLAEDLRRMGISTASIPDVLQAARERLLVAADGATARIAKYRGSGDLRSWLRVVALRDAAHQAARVAEVPVDDGALAALVAETISDVEFAGTSAAAREGFRQAFADAIDGLDGRERSVLRLNLVHGVSIDRIGELYGVHRATAARWVDRARTKLERTTRERMRERLAVTESECDSLLRLVWSSLDASIERMLDRQE
jgi:RNA polymerase sigma-70 factor (ECF subfamily)